MKTNILVLAAGHNGIENEEGGYPICLAEFDGKSLIERIVINTIRIQDAHYSFALLDKDIERFHLDKIVKLLAPTSFIYIVPENTKGSACTALLAASQLEGNAGLLIISANELVDIDFSKILLDFSKRKLDAGTLVFRSVHPRYSYVRVTSDGLVSEAAQQKPISQNATVGAFWFASTRSFVENTKNIIRKNVSVNGKFYVAPVFNELILSNLKVGVHEIDVSKYRPLKNERQVEQFEKMHRYE